MKKIVHLSHTDITTDSRILKEMTAAKKEGYSVAAVGIASKKNSDSPRFDNTTRIHSLYLRTRFWKLLPYFIRKFLTLLEFYIILFYKGIKEKPDVVHCNDNLVLPVGVLIKIYTRCKLIYDAHELESDKNGTTPFIGKVILFVEKMAWKRVDGLIVVSPSIEKWYHDNVGSKLSAIVLNSPEFDSSEGRAKTTYLRNKFEIPKGSKIFLYIGLLSSGRGIDIVLDAFRDSSINSHLVFLGYGDLCGYLEDMSANYHNIHLHKAIPHEQVVSVAQSADVGVCLIEKVSLSDYYCLPNKLFEYCFSGVPVLASNFPDLSTAIKEFGLGLCTDLDNKSIKRAIREFEQSENQSRFFKRDLHPLSWDVQVENLLGLYEQVLK